MAFLTSYRYRGVELNDGLQFAVPYAENTLDDRNSVESSFATRGLASPIQTGAEMRESTIALNINILASDAGSFQTRLEALYQLFNTQDPAFYKLERRLPHEAAYSYIEVSPRAFTVQRIERRASVTLVCADRQWKSSTEQVLNLDLFNGQLSADVTLTYDGLTPVEPVLELRPVTPGSDGTIPLYTRKVTVWAHQPQAVVGLPVKLTANWYTSNEVAAGKMREDGLDIVVDYGGGYKLNSDGTPNRPPAVSRVPRVVVGPKEGRHIWIRPTYWPYQGKAGTLQRATGRAWHEPAINTTDTQFYVRGDPSLHLFPAGVVLRIDDEYIRVASIHQEGALHRVVISERGANGSPVQNHAQFTPLCYPVDYYIGYGWGQGVNAAQGNDLAGWPRIDLVTSSNQEWAYAETAHHPYYDGGLVWRSDANLAVPLSPNFGGASVDTNGDGYLQAARFNGPFWSPSRLVGVSYALEQRIPSHFRLEVAFTGGSHNVAGVPYLLRRVIENYNTPAERSDVLWSASTATASGTLDTGYVVTDHWGRGGTHYAFEYGDLPGMASSVRATLTRMWVRFLEPLAPAPSAGSIGNEGGTAYGDFPVTLYFQNWSDAGSQTFGVAARMRQNEAFRLDCHTRELTGLYLSETSYTNLTWLRLMPGSNHIRFEAPAGAPRLQGTLRWRVVK